MVILARGVGGRCRFESIRGSPQGTGGNRFITADGFVAYNTIAKPRRSCRRATLFGIAAARNGET
jgi:hypothetical protein